MNDRIGTARALAAAIAVLMLIGAVPRPGSAKDSAAPERRLDGSGWAIDGISLRGTDRPGVRHMLVTGRIAAPPWLVWNVIRNTVRVRGASPDIKEAIVELAAADTTITRFKMAVPFYRDRRFRLRQVSDSRCMSLRFDMVPGFGNVREIRGRWIVGPSGDGSSRLTYMLDTDPGARLVPSFIVDWATRKAVPRFYESVYERCAVLVRGNTALSQDGSVGDPTSD